MLCKQQKNMTGKSLFKRVLIWRIKHISTRQFILLLSIIIGILTGLSVLIINSTVNLIKDIVHWGITDEYHNYLYFALPTIGIFLAVLFIKYVIRRPVRHGIPNVLHSISKKNAIMNSHNMFSSIITSALTIGFGGSVGLEGPTVATGSSLGANIGRLFHLNYKHRVLLLGCAASAAMAGIFKAPIAGVVFAIEVIMIDLTVASIVPLLLASVSSAITSYLFFGQEVLYHFTLKTDFELITVPFYIGLGILTGFVSLYFTKTYLKIAEFFDKFSKWQVRLLIGGSMLGVLIFFFPSLYGDGYEVINMALAGNYEYLFEKSLFFDFKNSFWLVILLIALVVIFKVIAASATFGAGGVGGIFAPTLFMGANTGLLFSLVVNNFNLKTLDNSNFALVGMGGLIAGVLQAPLTAIFLIADITSGYELLLPLMLVSTISYATCRVFEPNSVYTTQLARRKELITHHKDKAVLSLMRIAKLIECNFITVRPDHTLGHLIKVVAASERNIYPVTDQDNNFLGIVILNDIRSIMFKPEKYKTTYVRDLMFTPAEQVGLDDSMEDVAKKIQTSGLFNIVVVEEGKYLGFISRANLFSTYRRMLKHFSEH